MCGGNSVRLHPKIPLRFSFLGDIEVTQKNILTEMQRFDFSL